MSYLLQWLHRTWAFPSIKPGDERSVLFMVYLFRLLFVELRETAFIVAHWHCITHFLTPTVSDGECNKIQKASAQSETTIDRRPFSLFCRLGGSVCLLYSLTRLFSRRV
jgi:hypothetical protein